MSEKHSTSDIVKIDATGRFVRFYFTLAIDYVLPNAGTDDEIDDDWCGSLASTIAGKLADDFDGVVFKRFERHSKEENVFTIYFVISKLQSFKETDISVQKDNYSRFKIKANPLSLAKKEIMSQINNSLRDEYNISDLSLTFVTSRNFLFEMYFDGQIVVERKFTADEIRDAGSVSSALDHFSNDVVFSFEDSCWGAPFAIDHNNTKRRRPDNRYVFDVSATRVYEFGENEVHGDLTRFDCDTDAEDFMDIDNKEDALESRISALRWKLDQITLGMVLPAGNVVSSNMNFVDQDETVYDCDEQLVSKSAE